MASIVPTMGFIMAKQSFAIPRWLFSERQPARIIINSGNFIQLNVTEANRKNTSEECFTFFPGK
jgi:hypothetical protein